MTDRVRFTIVVQSRHALDSPAATGREIKDVASVPPGYALHRRRAGLTEVVWDDELIVVDDGDHFFAQPPDQADVEHR